MPTRLLRQPSILQVSMIAHNWRLPWTIPQISYLQAELHIASMTLVLLHVQRWASTGWRIFVAKVQLLYNQCILRVKQLQSPTVLPSQWPAFSRSTKVFQRMDMLFERSQVEAKILELDPWRTNNLLHTKSKALLVNRKELWLVRQVIPPKKNYNSEDKTRCLQFFIQHSYSLPAMIDCDHLVPRYDLVWPIRQNYYSISCTLLCTHQL